MIIYRENDALEKNHYIYNKNMCLNFSTSLNHPGWVDSTPIATTHGTLRQGFGWMKFQDSPLPRYLYYIFNLSYIILRITWF